VCNKLWYGIEIISNSHSASSQLSGEFMLFHSIHTLVNLALKETVPPQSPTSPHVTVKKIYIFNTTNSGQAQVAQKSWMNTVKNFRANSVFQGKRRVVQKSWMVRNIFHTVKILRKNFVFQGKRKLLKNPEQWKYFQYSVFSVQGVHKVLHTLKIFISQKPHKVETLHFRQWIILP